MCNNLNCPTWAGTAQPLINNRQLCWHPLWLQNGFPKSALWSEGSEASPPLHPSATADSTWVTAFLKGGLRGAQAGLLSFWTETAPKSLSRHYFWIEDLNPVQRHSVHVIISMGYILDPRWNLKFSENCLLSNLYVVAGFQDKPTAAVKDYSNLAFLHWYTDWSEQQCVVKWQLTLLLSIIRTSLTHQKLVEMAFASSSFCSKHL